MAWRIRLREIMVFFRHFIRRQPRIPSLGSMLAGVYPLYDPLPTEGQYIRLLHLLPGKHSHPISCKLSLANLDALEESYIAVSYTWGPADVKDTIWLNGLTFSVRENLYELLQAVRQSDRVVTLWVDAICINQSSVVERSHQVAQMTGIYENAIKVLVWLGSSSPAHGLAIEAMECLTDRTLHWTAHADGEPSLESLHPQFVNADWAEHLSDLFRRPWWSRVWTLQEAVLANDLVFCCGQYSFSWKTFEDFQANYLMHHGSPASPGCCGESGTGTTAGLFCSEFVILQSLRVNQLVQRSKRQAYHLSAKQISTVSDWLGFETQRQEYLRSQQIESTAARQVRACLKEIRAKQDDIRRRYEAATDSTEVSLLLAERDKLRSFAFVLSSMMQNADNFAAQKVLPSLQKMREEDSISILNIIATMRNRDCTEPRDKVYGISGLRLRITEDVLQPDYWFETIKIFEDFELEVITASRTLDIFTLLTPDNIARTASWIVDWTLPATAPLGPIQQQRLSFHTSVQASRNIYKGFKSRNQTISIPGVVCDYIRTICPNEDDKIAECLQPWLQSSSESEQNRDSPYGSMSNRKDAMLSCIVGCVPEAELKSELDDLRRHSTTGNLDASVWGCGSVRHNRAVVNSYLRRMFISDKGYIGLAPNAAKEGDLICVLYGGRVPYVLRRSGVTSIDGVEKSTYKLVGDSYVAGLMYGEAITMCEREYLQEDVFTLA